MTRSTKLNVNYAATRMAFKIVCIMYNVWCASSLHCGWPLQVSTRSSCLKFSEINHEKWNVFNNRNVSEYTLFSFNIFFTVIQFNSNHSHLDVLFYNFLVYTYLVHWRHNIECCIEDLVFSILYYFKFKLIFGVDTEIFYFIKSFIELV